MNISQRLDSGCFANIKQMKKEYNKIIGPFLYIDLMMAKNGMVLYNDPTFIIDIVAL